MRKAMNNKGEPVIMYNGYSVEWLDVSRGSSIWLVDCNEEDGWFSTNIYLDLNKAFQYAEKRRKRWELEFRVIEN